MLIKSQRRILSPLPLEGAAERSETGLAPTYVRPQGLEITSDLHTTFGHRPRFVILSGKKRRM